MLEQKAETKFRELNDAMREYHEVFGHEFASLPREPVLSNFYTPTDEQDYRELGFIALSMIPGRASAASIPNRPDRDAKALSLFLIHPLNLSHL